MDGLTTAVGLFIDASLYITNLYLVVCYPMPMFKVFLYRFKILLCITRFKLNRFLTIWEITFETYPSPLHVIVSLLMLCVKAYEGKL